MKKYFIVLLFLTMPAWATDRYPFSHEQQAQQFNQLIQEFRCLVCQNEDLASSNAALAEDLRQQVYQMVIAGKSNQEITDYMVNRYGDFVLFKPPVVEKTIFIWCLPFILLIAGFFIFYRITKRYSKVRAHVE